MKVLSFSSFGLKLMHVKSSIFLIANATTLPVKQKMNLATNYLRLLSSETF